MDAVIKHIWSVVKKYSPRLLRWSFLVFCKVFLVLVRLLFWVYVKLPLAIIGVKFSPELQALRR